MTYDLPSKEDIVRNGSTTGHCPTCHADTEFTHDHQGNVICVSCGNDPFDNESV